LIPTFNQKHKKAMSLGKWILGGLGFAVGGPIGALIGVFIASLFEIKSPIESGEYRQGIPHSGRNARTRATQGDIGVSIIVLLACVIKADGKILKSEISSVKPFLVRNFGEEGAKQALQLLRQLLEQEIDPIAVSQQIRLHVNYSVRLELVHLLLEVAKSDGEVVESECQVIETIAINMGIANADYQSLLSLYRKHTDANWAYTALEIEPTATDEEVKKAYRRMAMKYHPDKVANAGEAVRQQATGKFRAINEAYEYIKQSRGLA
jgi:DnaJ like chaperone protein